DPSVILCLAKVGRHCKGAARCAPFGQSLRLSSLSFFFLLSCYLLVPSGALAQTKGHQSVLKPEWCRDLPRPEYKSLERVATSDPWFEVYKVAPDTFAIYEPHQAEEVISYLILGKEKALLFDTGMGISDIRKLVSGLTALPVIVLNSHTHNDHVGGNWQFDAIYSMDTDFSRKNAKGSTADAQDELAPGQICGELPKGFDAKTYRTKPWTITKYVHDGDKLDLGGRTIEIISTPGHTPDANSIARLAALAPQVKTVIGSHNIPVAPPSVLPQLVAAFADLRAGEAACK